MAGRDVNININGKDNFSAAAGSAGKSANSLKATLSSLNGPIGGGGGLGGLLGGIGLAGATTAAVSFGVKSAAAFEMTAVSFTTMLKSGSRAKDLLMDLSKFAKETPFEFTELTDASRKLLAFGVGADDIISTLKRLGDVSSGISVPIGEIAEIYGKAKVQGRAFARDIHELTGRGIPVIQQLAKQFGVADDAVMKLVEDGKVGFKNIDQAFTEMTGKGGQFAGLMIAQAGTLSGKFSNLKDSIGHLAREWGGKLIPVMKLHVDVLNDLISQQEIRLPTVAGKGVADIFKGGDTARAREAINLTNAIDAGQRALQSEKDPAKRALLEQQIMDAKERRSEVRAKLGSDNFGVGKFLGGGLVRGAAAPAGGVMDLFSSIKGGTRSAGEGLDTFKKVFGIMEADQGPMAEFTRKKADLERMKGLLPERLFDQEMVRLKNELRDKQRGGMGNDRGEGPKWADVGRFGAVESRFLTGAPGHADPNEQVAKNTAEIAKDAKEARKKEEEDRKQQYQLLQRMLRNGVILKKSNMR